MKRTEAYRFSILISMLTKYERAMNSPYATEDERELPDVRRHDDHIEITTTTGQHVVLSGSALSVDGVDVALERMYEAGWPSPGPTPLEPDDFYRRKHERYSRLHVRHEGGGLTLTGLGPYVFPVHHFLEWARKHG